MILVGGSRYDGKLETIELVACDNGSLVLASLCRGGRWTVDALMVEGVGLWWQAIVFIWTGIY